MIRMMNRHTDITVITNRFDFGCADRRISDGILRSPFRLSDEMCS